VWNELLASANRRGIPLPATAENDFSLYFAFMMQENTKVNLTRITDPREACYKHFLDSLELLAWHDRLNGSVLDVGSGAGLPGIPLKIACPEITLTLLDSSQKRVAFLQQALGKLAMTNARAIHGRAETLGRDPLHRESYPLVVSRAVARLTVLSELCLPFVAHGGAFVAYKGPEGPAEAEEAAGAILQLGGQMEEIRPYTLPEQMGSRTLLVIRKTGQTPSRYPRKPGLPEKRPLC
jgi:16S rRNA (guanine527-N7)-methyltransferase